MYADRLEAEAAGRRSIKDRLNGTSGDVSTRRRQVTGKRQRQDDKWEHDLFEDDEPQLSKHKVHPQDLRLKLQKKSQQVSQSGARRVRDLREKLSGTMHPQPANTDPPKNKLEATKRAKMTTSVGARESETQQGAKPVAKKKSTDKADTSVDSFLKSLDLEKYSINFQAEEVDMTALVHMTDEDLKVMGIPMGPRKKILLALESRRR